MDVKFDKSSSENRETNKPQLSLFSFGNFEVKLNERQITTQFRTDKERGLLAYLIAESHRPHRREILGELLWPEREEGIARTNLRQAILGLRRAVGDTNSPANFMHVTNEFIQLNPAGQVWFDAGIFAGHIKFAQSHAHPMVDECPVCIQHLEEAVTLYRGEFLETVFVDSQPFQEWMVFKRETLFRDLLSALQSLASFYEKQTDYETARKFALKHVSLYPLEERAHRQLMRLLVLNGQRTTALEQYQICKKLLLEELGVEPGPQTQALYEQIRQGVSLVDLHTTPTNSPPSQEHWETYFPNNLPTPLTAMIGREEEIEQLTRCLASPVCRLTTLIGSPGVGKTRLAIHVAEKNRDKFPDGIWFVPLETIKLEEELLPAIAKAIGFVNEGQSLRDALMHHLQTQKALIILDNFEYLRPEGGVLLELLEKASTIKIMVTSRERINYQVACIFEIKGLPYPENPHADHAMNFPAVRLFLTRALHRQIQVSIPANELSHVVKICQLLEGLPLALELAAASVHQFSYTQIIDGIQNNLDMLKTSMPDVRKRHQSMYVAIHQSWTLLSADEQNVFARLGVFQGSFSLDAAIYIAGGAVSTLASLIDKSLVEMNVSRHYKLQLILRNFAIGKLNTNPTEASKIEERFARFYMDFLQQFDLTQISHLHHPVISEIEQEIDNIRSAWLWTAQHQACDGISQSMDVLWTYFNLRDQLKDGENFFQIGTKALKACLHLSDSGWLLSKALASLGWFLSRQGEYDTANKYYSESIACFENHHQEEALVFPYFGIGYVAYQLGDYLSAETSFYDAVQAGEKSAEQKWTLMAKLYLALVQFALGKNPNPEKNLVDILISFEKKANVQGQLRTLKQLGDIAHMQGDLGRAKNYYMRTAQLAKQLEQTGMEALLSLKLGTIACEEGTFPIANDYLQKALRIFQHNGNRQYLVLTLRELGSAAVLENQFQEAIKYFRQALNLALASRQVPLLLEVLSGIACMLANTQRQETAWELISLIQSHPATHPLTHRRVKALLTTCTQTLDEQKRVCAFKRGRSLDLMRVVAEFQVSL